MTTKSLFRLGVQLCGFYILYKLVIDIPGTIALASLYSKQLSFGDSAAQAYFYMALPALFNLVLGLILIFAAKKITVFFIREDSQENLKIRGKHSGFFWDMIPSVLHMSNM